MMVLAAPAFAECPAAPDIAGREDGLFAQMSSAENELAAREVSDGLWELWVMAPDEAAQEMLDEGMARREGYNFVGAIDVLDRLVEYCPDYAEGWNQRAFVAGRCRIGHVDRVQRCSSGIKDDDADGDRTV